MAASTQSTPQPRSLQAVRLLQSQTNPKNDFLTDPDSQAHVAHATMQAIDPQQASICNPPGSRLFIVCGRSVEGEKTGQGSLECPVIVDGASYKCFCAEATLQAAFAPFGTIQNIKLIKEKGVSRQTAAAAASRLTVTAACPRFQLVLADGRTCSHLLGRVVIMNHTARIRSLLGVPGANQPDPVLAISQQVDRNQFSAGAS